MGVFRNSGFIRRTARALGLFGTVENIPDGSVEIIAEGDEVKLNELLISIKKGLYFPNIDTVEEQWSNAGGGFSGFHII